MQGAYLYSSKARKRHSDWPASEHAGSDNERKVTQKWLLRRSRESIQELYYVAAAARLVNRAARSVGRPVCRPVDHDSAEYKSDQSILRKTCPHSLAVRPSFLILPFFPATASFFLAEETEASFSLSDPVHKGIGVWGVVLFKAS